MYQNCIGHRKFIHDKKLDIYLFYVIIKRTEWVPTQYVYCYKCKSNDMKAASKETGNMINLYPLSSYHLLVSMLPFGG